MNTEDVSSRIFLDGDTIRAIHEAAISAQLASSRAALLSGLDPHIEASLQTGVAPSAQLLLDLNDLNTRTASITGELPLEHWLQNAKQLSHGRQEADVFERAVEVLRRKHSRKTRNAALPPVGLSPKAKIVTALLLGILTSLASVLLSSSLADSLQASESSSSTATSASATTVVPDLSTVVTQKSTDQPGPIVTLPGSARDCRARAPNNDGSPPSLSYRGVVIDAHSHLPIPGLRASLLGVPSCTSITDDAGLFDFGHCDGSSINRIERKAVLLVLPHMKQCPPIELFDPPCISRLDMRPDCTLLEKSQLAIWQEGRSYAPPSPGTIILIDEEATIRRRLEPKVFSGKGSLDEMRMLRAICGHMGDKSCKERADRLLQQKKQELSEKQPTSRP